MEFLTRRLEQLLWPAQTAATQPRARWLALARYSFALVRDLLIGDLSLRAMSLVYTTMLAVVPFLAFSFSVLKGLGFHRQLEPLLMNFFAPLGERAEEVTARVIGFVDNVSGSTLAGISIVLLLYTALSMAQKVETSFNFVWRVNRPRSLARRFSEYLSVMLVGPLVMSVALGFTAALANGAAMRRLQEYQPIGNWVATLGQLMPYVLVTCAFTFLYVFVPNTRVRLKPALAGGLFAGILWAAGGTLFASFVVNASRAEIIYSGFAIVIVAMLWIYVSWLILLLGAQLAFYVQNPDYLRLGQRTIEMSNALRERLALGAMLLVGREFDAPGHGLRVDTLAERMHVPRHVLEPVLGTLLDAGLLTVAADLRLLPAQAPRKITLLQILSAVRTGPRDSHAVSLEEWHPLIQRIADNVEQAIRETVVDQTLADLMDAAELGPHGAAAERGQAAPALTDPLR